MLLYISPTRLNFSQLYLHARFYDLTVILIPYDQSFDTIISFLRKSKADTIVAAVGSFPFDIISKNYPALKQLVWVVDEGSKHMDWNEIPTGTGGAVKCLYLARYYSRSRAFCWSRASSR